MASSFLRRATVQQRLGVGRTKLVEMIEAGTFPRPVKVDGNIHAWPDSDVEAFIQSRIAAERGQPQKA